MNILKHLTVLNFACIALFVTIGSSTQAAQEKQAKPEIKGASQIIVDENTNSVSFVKLDENTLIPANDAANWLKTNILGASEKSSDFKLIREESDNLGFTHARYKQFFNGIPVEDAVYIVHSKNGHIVSANGVAYKGIKAPIKATLSKNAIFKEALAHVKAEKYAWEDPKNRMKSPAQGAELMILKSKSSYKLVYKIDIYAIQPLKRVYLYIDAKKGTVIKEINRIETIDASGKAATQYSGLRTIITDSIGPTSFKLKESGRGGGINTYDMKNQTDKGQAIDIINTSNFWDNEKDRVAYDAHFGAEVTYDFYMNRFSRNSYDAAGAAFNSYVHYANGYVNAFWDGSTMTYGDGDDNTSGSLTSLEIIGHELAHGYTQYMADLGSSPESGALNESFSDIFGNTIRQESKQNANINWFIGDEFIINGTVGSAFRDMAHPNHYAQPDTYKGAFWDSVSQEIHQNDGVQNYWYYLLVSGGTGINDKGTSYSIKGIGLDDAIQIVYRSESTYLTSISGYKEARIGSIQSAIDLFGACSNQVIQTINAWNAVGLGAKDTSSVNSAFVADHRYSCSPSAAINFINASSNATSYMWYFGDGDTSTAANPTHTYLSPGKYTVKLIATGNSSCGNTTDSLVLTDYINISNAGSPITPICTPATQNFSGGYGIGKVIFNTIDNSSANASEGYKDFSCISNTEVIAGNLYSLSVSLTNSSIGSLVAWIDLNNDGAFTESEKILDTSAVSRYISAKVVIPDGAVLNTPLRMRIGFDQTTLDGCTNADKGQYEDYGVTIKADTLPPVADFRSFQGCNGDIAFWTNSTLHLPKTWHWDFGDGNSSTSSSPLHTYASTGTYNVTFKICSDIACDSISKPVNVVLTPGPKFASCRPKTISNCCGAGITQFKFATIDNQTGDGGDGYKDYSCSINTTVAAAGTYVLAVTVGTLIGENIKVWIDYDNDGSFSNTSEVLTSFNAAKGLKSKTVTVSATAAQLNIPLRMRVGSDYSGVTAPNGCSDVYYGQYEDYSVIITPAVIGINNQVAAEKVFDIYPNPVSNHVNILYQGTNAMNANIQIIDIAGRQVYSSNMLVTQNGSGFEINLPNGMYSIKITDMYTNESSVKKLIVQQ